MSATTERMRLGSPAPFGLLTLAMLAAIVFWLGAVMPYLTSRQDAFGQFWDRRYSLWIHIFGGTLAMFSGPVQIWLGETRQRLALHRSLGFAYVAGAAITCGAGWYLSLTTPVGIVFGAGLFGMATACAMATTMALVAIRRRNFVQHREWMIRSYVVILAFVFFRLIFVSLRAMDVGGTDAVRLTLAAWGSWAFPLLITELLLQWPKLRR